MRPFTYHKPKSVQEAVELLARLGEGTAILAGGTDLLVELKKRVRTVFRIVDIKGLRPLEGFGFDSQGALRLGPLLTMQALSTSPALTGGFTLLAKAASKVGSLQVRNRATIGGNICQASPSGDTLPALLCLNSRAKLKGKEGERIISLEDFFLGPGKNALGTDEILTEILIPPPPEKSCAVYKKLSLRRAMDPAVVGVAILGTFDRLRGCFKEIRIGLGAVAPTPLRAKKAEGMLTGVRVREGLIKEAAAAASDEARPLSDIRGSEWYRREMVKQFTEEAVKEMIIQNGKS